MSTNIGIIFERMSLRAENRWQEADKSPFSLPLSPMNPPIEIRIAIPAYHEPEILQTIESLLACRHPPCGVEIGVAVNSYAISPEAIKSFNRQTYSEIQSLARSLPSSGIRLTPFLFEDLPGRQTGAGLPRKLVMDWAVAQFEAEKQPQGILLSLDADCKVASNYLTAVYEHFRENRLRSATLAFHHPVEHLPPSSPLRRATEAYESYLHYYRAALQYMGYPYAYHTIGSAFAVTAQTYRQVGGMGKQQAGEDFYFLQKVFPLGRTQFIASTCVYPAARTSDRVPFGTGPALAKMMAEGQFNKQSYRIDAFEDLRRLFGTIDTLFKKEPSSIESYLQTLPIPLRRFLASEPFTEKISEISRYTRTAPSFRKRFFDYFNAFKTLRYLNSVHPDPYPLADVETEGWPSLRARMRECDSDNTGFAAPILPPTTLP
jgi:hypothetical protein